jgi:hypothetical protein
MVRKMPIIWNGPNLLPVSNVLKMPSQNGLKTLTDNHFGRIFVL